MDHATPTPTIVLSVLEGNDPVSLTPLQQMMAPHLDVLTVGWMAVWCTTAVCVLIYVYRAWRDRAPK